MLVYVAPVVPMAPVGPMAPVDPVALMVQLDCRGRLMSVRGSSNVRWILVRSLFDVRSMSV